MDADWIGAGCGGGVYHESCELHEWGSRDWIRGIRLIRGWRAGAFVDVGSSLAVVGHALLGPFGTVIFMTPEQLIDAEGALSLLPRGDPS